MREREQRAAGRHRVETALRAPRQLQVRWTEMPDDLDVLPQHAARVPRPERLHRRFLGGKARRQARDRVAVPRTIGNLAIGEHPVQKPIAVPFEDVTHARDVGGIEAETQDAHV